MPKRPAGGDCLVNLHEKFLAITNTSGGMVIGAGAGVRCILIGRLDEDYLGQLIGRRVPQVRLHILETAKGIAEKN